VAGVWSELIDNLTASSGIRQQLAKRRRSTPQLRLFLSTGLPYDVAGWTGRAKPDMGEAHRHRWNFHDCFLAIPFRETLHDLLGNKFMEAKVPPRSKEFCMQIAINYREGALQKRGS